MPQQGLHCAQGSPRRIEQTRCEVTQPVPIKALQPKPYGSRSELPIEQVPAAKCSSRGVGGRYLLAVIASLILSASKSSTLTSEAGKGLPFWTTMRASHAPEERSEFSRRTATWNRLEPPDWNSTGKGIFYR
jgi:hypothetical protein